MYCENPYFDQRLDNDTLSTIIQRMSSLAEKNLNHLLDQDFD